MIKIIERIKKYWLEENEYYIILIKYLMYIRILLEIIIMCIWVYLLFNGLLNKEYLLRALKIFVIIITYWYIINKLFNCKILFKKEIKKDIKYIKNDKIRGYINKIINYHPEIINIRFFIRNSIWLPYFIWNEVEYKKRLYIYLVVYYIKYVLIFMWPWLLYGYIIKKVFFIKIAILGYIDIKLKKYFNIMIRIKTSDIGELKSYKILRYIISKPIIRILMYPTYIKQKISQKKWYEIIQLRLYLYCYMSVLLWFGYGEIINYVYSNKIILISIVWVYFTIIFPYIIEVYIYNYPSNGYISYKEANLKELYNTVKDFNITYRLYNDIFEGIYGSDILIRRYHHNKVKVWNEEDTDDSIIYIRLYYGWKRPAYVGKNYTGLWKYERNYSVPRFVVYRLFIKGSNHSFERMHELFNEGILRYGIVFMLKEYGHYYKQALNYNKCIVYFIFEMQRLTNQEYYAEVESKDSEKFKFEINYEEIPEKYEGMKLYKEIIKYYNFFSGSVVSPMGGGEDFFFIPELYGSMLADDFMNLMEQERIGVVKNGREEYEKLWKDSNNERNKEGFLFLQDRIELDTAPYFAYLHSLPSFKGDRGMLGILKHWQHKELIIMKDIGNVDVLKTYYYSLWQEEYENEVKNLKNVRSIDIVKKEINKYLKSYPGEERNKYEFAIKEMQKAYEV